MFIACASPSSSTWVVSRGRVRPADGRRRCPRPASMSISARPPALATRSMIDTRTPETLDRHVAEREARARVADLDLDARRRRRRGSPTQRAMPVTPACCRLLTIACTAAEYTASAACSRHACAVPMLVDAHLERLADAPPRHRACARERRCDATVVPSSGLDERRPRAGVRSRCRPCRPRAPCASRRVRARRREQGREHAVVHDRVDLHALDLGRVLAHRVAVAVERGGLRAVDGTSRPAAAS